MAIICVLAAQASGAEIAAAATKHASKKHRSAPHRCVGANVTATDETTRRRAARSILCLVNRERRMRGRPALRRSKPLAKAAVRHSAWIVGRQFFSHSGSTGDVLRRVIRSGYIDRESRRVVLGETLAWGVGAGATPAALVAAFMESRSHRRTLISRRYRDVGVGLALGAPRSGVAGNAATLTLDLGRR